MPEARDINVSPRTPALIVIDKDLVSAKVKGNRAEVETISQGPLLPNGIAIDLQLIHEINLPDLMGGVGFGKRVNTGIGDVRLLTRNRTIERISKFKRLDRHANIVLA
jgi:hypothetical protein